ncbi:hypothetical protein ACS0TY_028998 [Phlomoides rotata]
MTEIGICIGFSVTSPTRHSPIGQRRVGWGLPLSAVTVAQNVGGLICYSNSSLFHKQNPSPPPPSFPFTFPSSLSLSLSLNAAGFLVRPNDYSVFSKVII